MQSNSLQQPEGIHVSDVTWARLLEILQTSSRAGGQLPPGNPSHGSHPEALVDFPAPPSLTGSSPSPPGSPRERSAAALHDLFAAASSASSQPQLLLQQHLHHQLQQHNRLANHHQSQQNNQPQRQLQSGASDSSHSRSLLLLGQLSRRVQAAGAAAAAQAQPGSQTADMLGLDMEEGASASVSASAERHRLISESTGVSVQMFVEWVADLIPFLLLLVWVFIFKHAGVLLLILFLGAYTFNVNADIRRLIALRREARLSACVVQALTVAAFSATAVLATLPDTRLLRVLTLQGVPAANAVDTFLLVLLADSVLRFGSLAPKLLVVAWFRSRGAAAGMGFGAAGDGGGGGGYLSGARRQRQQSRVLTVVERGVTLYRTVLPGPVWYGYLLHGGGFSPVLASLFCGFYLVLKASYVAAQTRLFALALKTATRQGALYGTYVGRAESGEGGTIGACPVCQDPVNTPVRLDCGHIFCEECILEWLERDRTCPMCRAEVRPAGLPSCSDGASPSLPQIF
ncbi:hypothetical protein PLESTB_000716600 [Pleodorina starrii]|uniref:RING-type domain-containing protein n=1 Tax=Pleodorina starrii TaxID=330485 RepID=A0A9W6BJK1_9CHLO|nr:hypothetical protein PLESTM_001710900 [Pleodorina starrii]GLC53178.1 hypothetical protein PLESTB_000716600 [Pleodorina starrii]GLC68633.1 hypothetical protein PLESTF_000717200 [Pleodorina starrii]